MVSTHHPGFPVHDDITIYSGNAHTLMELTA